MKRIRRLGTTLVMAGVLVAGPMLVSVPLGVHSAGADTDPTTVTGQGGSFLEPVLSKLLADDSSNLSPLFGSFLQTDDVSGIASFIGSGPGQFTADFAVTQRPLTSAETATAKANGRTYAYVPFAATPVSMVTLVPTQAWEQSGNTGITSADFCQNMPLTTTLLGELIGYDAASPLHSWGDARITCPASGGGTTADPLPVLAWANLDPSMANDATMGLLDSAPDAKGFLQAALGRPGSLTTDPTPSELWPFAGSSVPGGDQPLIGKLLNINSETNAPGLLANNWQLGAIAPMSSAWTGSPLGVSWDLPTAGIQNTQGSFVAPTLAAAQAAATDSTMAATSEPTTNNLVTFNASATDAAAYNSLLMEESYLVVPLNGLPANKATALSQIVRFILGPQGQSDIEGFGSAPATASEQAAGLKVAAQLSAVAAASPNSQAAGTTSTSSAGTSTTAAASAAGASSTASGTESGSDPSGSGAASDSSGGLAFTGMSHLGAWVGLGALLAASGAILRRRLKRQETAS